MSRASSALGLESVYELALRFALAKPGIACVLVGFSSMDQLEQAIAWCDRGPLPADQVRQVLNRRLSSQLRSAPGTVPPTPPRDVDCRRSMKASMLCGAHYAGAEAHFQRPPVSPTFCDPDVASLSFDQWLDYAALADELGFDWVSVSEHPLAQAVAGPGGGS